MKRTMLQRAGRVYKQYWRINILTTLEYRANFIMWFLFTFVYHGTAIVALWIVFENFPSMNGWSFKDMAFLYGLWMVSHALNNTLFSTVSEIPDHIRDGEFDRLLVRPLDSLYQCVTIPGQVFPDELVLALVYFGFATWLSHVHINLMFVLFVPLIVLGGTLIELSLNLIISTAAFWFIKVDALRWIIVQLEQEFTRYPISIYSRGVRLLLAFVLPFAFMNYFPATYFLNKSENALALPPAVGLLTPVIGAVFFAAAYAFWRLGLNRYKGVGH